MRDPVMTLHTLLQGFVDTADVKDCSFMGMTQSSGYVSPAKLFIAYQGEKANGCDHIDTAVAQGAAAILHDGSREIPKQQGVSLVMVPRLKERVGELAARYYGDPSQHMTVIGVTGTSGKTSFCHFTASLLEAIGVRCGILGTVGNGFLGKLIDSPLTTLDAIAVQQELARLRAEGAIAAAMEVSSHALMQHRVNGVAFAAAVFTNLSHDHLDYHHNLKAYAEAKYRLFQCKTLKCAVVNLDDTVGQRWLPELVKRIPTTAYSLTDAKPIADAPVWRAYDLKILPDAVSATWEMPTATAEIRVPVLGVFNMANILAVVATLSQLGFDTQKLIMAIPQLKPVPGRMECFGGTASKPLVVIDYAHKPDALEQVLKSLRQHTQSRLICVVGCGGDRDKTKRPMMGKIALAGADYAIFTNDNPRTEDPSVIIASMMGAVVKKDSLKVIEDRKLAIQTAIKMAAPTDVVLIAGKGHETYQIIGTDRQFFSDKDEVLAILEEPQR
jgi:UDP-N-acetylmuramoyl-L-alanyl-D-glutamate--2,6-diaminopimelate ligase